MFFKHLRYPDMMTTSLISHHIPLLFKCPCGSFKLTGRIPLVVRAAKVFMSQQSTGVHFAGGHDGYRDAFLKHAVKALGLSYRDDDLGGGVPEGG